MFTLRAVSGQLSAFSLSKNHPALRAPLLIKEGTEEWCLRLTATSHCLRMEKPRTPKAGARATLRSRGLNGPRDGLYYPLELGDFNLELLPA
jgi:hypothetical protein